ncbi:Ribonuclease III domain-containing protein isoform 2 [Venturia nashicola]|nr:Ribonuclease III domain-containing protein isoform 2 [Venturia nashicola]
MAVPGDSIIALLLNKESYEHGLSRKAMNNKVQKIGGNSNLTIVGKNHHFEVFINPNNAQVELGDSTFATTVEALVGAADADGGLEAAATVMTALGLL